MYKKVEPTKIFFKSVNFEHERRSRLGSPILPFVNGAVNTSKRQDLLLLPESNLPTFHQGVCKSCRLNLKIIITIFRVQMRLRIFLRGVESCQAFQHSERIWKVKTWSSSFLSLWLLPHFFSNARHNGNDHLRVLGPQGVFGGYPNNGKARRNPNTREGCFRLVIHPPTIDPCKGTWRLNSGSSMPRRPSVRVRGSKLLPGTAGGCEQRRISERLQVSFWVLRRIDGAMLGWYLL